jgi:hydrogenase maturation protein HypF
MLGKAYSKIWKTNLIEIQHHKAHFCSVFGEHQLFDTSQKILGVIWDGTGLGDDYQIWGGEFFIYENRKIKRLTHFEYFDWIANDKMAKEPRLSLLSLLNEEDRGIIKEKFSKTEWNVYNKLLKQNSLKTSSVGRLFDAVASALNIIDINTFEAEAAMLLEDCANSTNSDECIDLLGYKKYDRIPSKLLLRIIVKAYKEDSISKAFIARSFIYTLAKIIIKIAKQNNIKIIVCSGGVFQNTILISMLISLAKKGNIDIKLNRKLSANDENISFGQLIYYQNIKY